MNKPLILVVEDDRSVNNLITTILKTHDYRYLTALNGAEAVLEASSHNPDIVLLDLGLPDTDGVDIIKKIRTWSNMPIIVISARNEDKDKIEALDAGADDYVTKPCSVEELLARLRATTRRLSASGQTQAEDAVFENGELRIEYAAGCAWLGDKELHLTPIEYKLLCLLARNVGKVLTHTYIMQQIWGSSGASDIASLRVFMATLRKKIDSSADGPQYIQTHIGVGYRMMKGAGGDHFCICGPAGETAKKGHCGLSGGKWGAGRAADLSGRGNGARCRLYLRQGAGGEGWRLKRKKRRNSQ